MGKMRALIVTGGTIQLDFARNYIEAQKFDLMIAGDSGMEFFRAIDKIPQYIVGDFDSANPETISFFRAQKNIVFREFRPEKDETDTELAISMAMELKADEICILGATGTRLDHVLGNIHLLCKPLKRNISCYIQDAHNRIRLIEKKTTIGREEQFGKYVSLLPLTTDAGGITLEGFKYPLHDAVMTSDNSLGVSNEIAAEQATIDLKSGILILIESRD